MMNNQTYALVLFLVLQIVTVSSFIIPTNVAKRAHFDCKSVNQLRIERKALFELKAIFDDIPTTVNSRLKLTISGPSVSSALFRAELKKELCFYRGCRGLFTTSDSLSGISELVCEGKTAQISRFLTWLDELKVDVSARKASFQGPSLIAYIDKLGWEEYTVRFYLCLAIVILS